MTTVARVGIVLLALALLAGATVLGYIAVIALRRNEGVFLPAGYVGLALLAGAVYLLRLLARG